jgi:hypothetical protein
MLSLLIWQRTSKRLVEHKKTNRPARRSKIIVPPVRVRVPPLRLPIYLSAWYIS